jgi:hypothetical protein
VSILFLADRAVAPGMRPIGDSVLRAPDFWSRLRALRAERAGDDTVGRLRAALVLERGLARQLAAHAERFHHAPVVRAGLLALAARADHCAQRLGAALGELGTSAPSVAVSEDIEVTHRAPLGAHVEDLRAATERYLDDACAVARHHPWLSRLLLAVRDDKAEDLRKLVQLRARLGLDGLDDAGSAPVPAVVDPEPDPAIGRLDLGLAA